LIALRREISETHIIGHAYGNNDIAKGTANGPYLQVMTLDNWEQTCMVVYTVPNGTPLDGRQFGAPEQGVMFLRVHTNPSCYPSAKLNERELCTVQKFWGVQILNVVDLFQ